MRNLTRYIITRILLTIPMVLILLSIIFVVLRLMPGDPVSSMLGGHAPERVIEQKKEELGLNRPMVIQYLDYLWQVCRLDFGESMVLKQRVTKAIAEKLPATIELTFFGLVITLFLGVFMGAYAADRRRQVQDSAIRLYGIVVYCIPVYWMGLMLQLIFGIWLDLLPIAGRTGPRVFASMFEKTGFYVLDTILVRDFSALGDVFVHLTLPAFTLGLVLSGIFVRLTRANMLDVLRADYIQYAGRSQGRLHYCGRSEGHSAPENRLQACAEECVYPRADNDGTAGCPPHGRRSPDGNNLFLAGNGPTAFGAHLPEGLPHHPRDDYRIRIDRGVSFPDRGYHLCHN
jgi:peptide/nickel transport system permease protein